LGDNLGLRQHWLVGSEAQKFLLELFVVIADSTESARPDSARHFGAHSTHGNLSNLSLCQTELLPDFLLIAAERGEKPNPLDVAGG